MRVRFDQVVVKGKRRWKDEQGKWRQETRTFMQTVNPFNKNKDGLPKNKAQIYEELLAERGAWLRGTARVLRGASDD